MSKRRQFFKKLAALGGGLAAAPQLAKTQASNVSFVAPGDDAGRLPQQLPLSATGKDSSAMEMSFLKLSFIDSILTDIPAFAIFHSIGKVSFIV